MEALGWNSAGEERLDRRPRRAGGAGREGPAHPWTECGSQERGSWQFLRRVTGSD